MTAALNDADDTESFLESSSSSCESDAESESSSDDSDSEYDPGPIEASDLSADDDESHVQVVQGEAPHGALVVVIQGHGEHVEPDEDHDDHVKLLVGHYPEHDGLRLPLEKNT